MKPRYSNISLSFENKTFSPFSGLAGYNAWNGWEKENEHLRDITIRVQDHMNGEDVINTLSNTWGAWKHGMGKAEIKNHKNEIEALETQYYQSSDKKKIVGYVRNRTFNVATKGIDTPCINSEYNWNIPNEKLPAIVKLRNLEWDSARVGQRLRIDDSCASV